MPLTQEFLAQMLGVQRTSVTNIARSLQNAGLIKYKRGHISVVDRSKVEQKACECYGAVKQRNEDFLINIGKL